MIDSNPSSIAQKDGSGAKMLISINEQRGRCARSRTSTSCRLCFCRGAKELARR